MRARLWIAMFLVAALGGTASADLQLVAFKRPHKVSDSVAKLKFRGPAWYRNIAADAMVKAASGVGVSSAADRAAKAFEKHREFDDGD
jgi:hypothetical protein